MFTKAPILAVKPFVCIAAVAAWVLLLPAAARAKDHEVAVTVLVSTAGLELGKPLAVRDLYRRVQLAARSVCDHGKRVDLLPPANFASCYEKALGDAIRSAHLPQLSTVYLATHTRGDAATYGIEVPVQVAAE